MTAILKQYSFKALVMSALCAAIAFGSVSAQGMMMGENSSWDNFYSASSTSSYYNYERNSYYSDRGYYGGSYGPGHHSLDSKIQEVVVTGHRDNYGLDPNSWHHLQQNLLWNMDVSFNVWDGNYTPPTLSSKPPQSEKQKCESNGGQWLSFPVLADPRSIMPKILSACKPAITPAVCNSVATISGASFAASKSGKAVGRACTSHPLAGGICGAATVTIGLWCNDVTVEDIF